MLEAQSSKQRYSKAESNDSPKIEAQRPKHGSSKLKVEDPSVAGSKLKAKIEA